MIFIRRKDLLNPANFYCTYREFLFLAFSRKVARTGKNQTMMVRPPRMALIGRMKKRVKSHSDLIMLIMKFCSKMGPKTRPSTIGATGYPLASMK